MDGDLMLIFGFVLIVTALALVLGGRIHKRDIAHKERLAELGNESAGANPAGSTAKIEKLEKRVRVLERLATDRGQDLAIQIEELRENTGEELKIASRELER